MCGTKKTLVLILLLISYERRLASEPSVLDTIENLAPSIGREKVVTSAPKMIEVDGGYFLMGTNTIQHKVEERASPTHAVILSPFSIAETLVTQGLWDLFIKDSGYEGYTYKHAYYGKLIDNSQGPDSPAIFLTWCEAVVFCNWLSLQMGFEPAYRIGGSLDTSKRGGIDVQWVRGTDGFRLVTEAEWEYVVYEKGAPRDSLYALYADAYATKQQRKVPSVFSGQRTSSGALAYPNFGISEWTWDEYMLYGADPLSDPTGRGGLQSTGSSKVNRYFVDKILFNRLYSAMDGGWGEFITIRLAQDRK